MTMPTQNSQAILDRIEAADHTRIVTARARFSHEREIRGQIAHASNTANAIEREGGDAAMLEKANATTERHKRSLALSQTTKDAPTMTAARLQSALPRHRDLIDAPRNYTLLKGETKPTALTRVRGMIWDKKPERKAVSNAPRTLAEVKSQVAATLDQLARKGQPLSLDMFSGGALELPQVKLPLNQPQIFYVPDGVALLCWLLRDEIEAKLESLLEFNSDDDRAMSDGAKEKALAAIDAELEKLGREEAALVEAIVAEGGTAHHRPDADVLHVLGLEFA